ncbi:DUF1329 domain-containing protein [Magnetospirillum molischianum]|uniref:Outer membrane lipoprotein-sorting protein n=1 Tax=Magnetospirillum molischianum DSM 120 TaxID=1150626 RepID=H8FSB1_MAGML|nr:DUF1329 domain-containing protein [Magnetospirillum molischianum]CCG41249.1 conserved exported hypothetical protein [Magnetospirillum molischianum DSM 120]
MKTMFVLKSLIGCGALALMFGGACSAWAAATPEELARLGKDLTPVGAEVAGNADGSIPAWTGGLKTPPPGFSPEKGYIDPFADEKPLYTITAANADSYQDKLAPGSYEMLKRYPNTFRMHVYPSHRTAVLPQVEYDRVKQEAGAAQLTPSGTGIDNVVNSTVPFPLPKSGLEVMWNHILRYRGGTVHRYSSMFPVQSGGSFTAVKREEWLAWAAALGNPDPNRHSYYLNLVRGPSSMAGEALLVHDSRDHAKDERRAWSYNPGLRRVLRAPEVAHDAPAQNSDGLATSDDYDGFNGSPERFDWKLIGKKELLIAYNNYRLNDRSLKYAEIIQPNHLNQDLVRYEPHRVWVVEGTLKPGARHIYAKRVFYIDEDSWQVAEADEYDGRGELWRVHILHAIQFYDANVPWIANDAVYDLQARRYIVNAMTNEEKPTTFGEKQSFSMYSPDNLRRVGN